MKNRFKKLIAMLSCIAVLCTVFTSSAFAMENEESSNVDMVALEDTDLSMEEVCNLFNITKEEAKGAQIYASGNGIYLNPGYHDLGTFTFTENNIGVYRQIKGHQVDIGIYYKPYDNYSVSQNMDVYFFPYDTLNINDAVWHYLFHQGIGSTDANGYYYASSGKIDVNYDGDYRFAYYLSTAGGGDYYDRTAQVHVVMIVYP